MILHVPFVAYQELAGEQLGDEARALGRGVDEVGADEWGMAVIPEGHGAVAAHGLICFEEAAAGPLGDALLVLILYMLGTVSDPCHT